MILRSSLASLPNNNTQYPHPIFFSIFIATMSNITRENYGNQRPAPKGRENASPKAQDSLFCLTRLGTGRKFQDCRAQCRFCKRYVPQLWSVPGSVTHRKRHQIKCTWCWTICYMSSTSPTSRSSILMSLRRAVVYL
jgi:hypothetical protein